MTIDPWLLYAVPDSNPSQLFFKTYFASGVTVGAPYNVAAPADLDATGINFMQDFSGTDSITGFTFPTSLEAGMGTGVRTYSQVLPDYTTTARNLGAQLENILQPTSMCAGIPGARELYQVQHTRTLPASGIYSKPQNDFHVMRANASPGNPPTELRELFTRKRIILPGGLGSAMVYADAITWYGVFHFKTGGFGGVGGYGDFRIYLDVVQGGVGDAGLRWKLSADNNANDGGVVPSVGNPNVGTGGFWAERSDAGSVVLGEELEVEMYFKRPPLIWERDTVKEPGATTYPYIRNTTDGIAIAVITRLSTGERIVLSKVGGIHSGSENLPQTRIMGNLTYCMGKLNGDVDPVMWSKCTALEFRDKPDYDMLSLI